MKIGPLKQKIKSTETMPKKTTTTTTKKNSNKKTEGSKVTKSLKVKPKATKPAEKAKTVKKPN